MKYRLTLILFLLFNMLKTFEKIPKKSNMVNDDIRFSEVL